MFPSQNVHYIGHYNVGYAKIKYPKQTEYRLKYTNVPKEYELAHNEEDLNKNSQTNLLRSNDDSKNQMPIEKQSQADVFEQAIENNVEETKKASTENKEDPPPEHKSNNNNGLFEEENKKVENKKEENKKEAEVESPPENSSKEKSMITNHQARIGQMKAYRELSEKKARAQKYRELLDLQMNFKNQQIAYEETTKNKAKDLAQQRLKEIEKQDREIKLQEKNFQTFIRKQYDYQIAARKKRQNNRSPSDNPAYNTNLTMEIGPTYYEEMNYKRYRDVNIINNNFLIEIR